VVQVPMIDADGISAALPLATCIELMADALRAFDRRDVVQPMRSVIQLPDGSGSLYTMPAFIAQPRALTVKMITIFHGNEGGPLPTHQGVVVVFDPRTGAPSLLLDAARLTAIRTAAVSAVATRVLAREDATVLAVLGTGVQARSHIEAMPLVRPIREVRIWGRRADGAQRLADEIAAAGTAAAFDVVVCDSATDAVTDADIVCTTTAAREPVLQGRWLRRGVHINAVGASTANARELNSAVVARSRIFVDSIDAALTEAGDLLIPMREGMVDARDWSPIGAVLNGTAVGRATADDITLFKSVGLAIEDAAAAAHIARRRPVSGGS
jgi:alanine dehydrogenase